MLPLFLLLQAAVLPPPPASAPFCVPAAAVLGPIADGDVYQIIGRSVPTGSLYTGTLAVQIEDGRYVLTRSVGGTEVAGKAVPVLCGPDKVRLWEVSYATTPVTTRFLCRVTTDYDNEVLGNCGPDAGADPSHASLEAWFPVSRVR